MRTSAAGLDLIRRYEGCILTAYQDRFADPPVWTIGYGETGPYVTEGLVYTHEQAEHGLIQRLMSEFEPAVQSAIGDGHTSQGEWDAMISLAWNIGTGAFAGSAVARLHKADRHPDAADAFLEYVHAGGVVRAGLVTRRQAERALYLFGAVPTVRDIQVRLNNMGSKLVVDGVAGPKTCRAILTALDELV